MKAWLYGQLVPTPPKILWGIRSLERVCGDYGSGYTSPRLKGALQFHLSWHAALDKVVQNGIGYVFVKDPSVAVALEIQFQAL